MREVRDAISGVKSITNTTYATTQKGHASGRERNLREAPGIVIMKKNYCQEVE